MRTVITISLNGNAYQIDAVGFDALRAYLQVAEQRLVGNPDREEILEDLEQAIADKCLRYLGPHKNVVSAGEITEVLREMGPVDGGASEGQAQAGQGNDAGAAGTTNSTGAGQSSGASAAGAPDPAWPGSGPSDSGSNDPWTGLNGDRWASSGAGMGASGAEAGSGADAGAGTWSAGAGASTGGTSAPGSGAWTTNPGATANTPGTNTPPLRRFYLIREGAAIGGVCKGLGAYLNIDVSIIRLLFIVLTILTGGVWILIYLVMMFVVPYAQTSEQHAAAHGWPFNAEELIARAKAHYAEFKNSNKWQRQQWRAQQRMWKTQNKQWKQQRRDWERHGSAQGFPPPPPPPWTGTQSPPSPNQSYANQVLSGVFGPLADLVGVLLFLGFLFALFSVISHHRVFWWPLPIDVPSWMGIVFLVIVYQVVVAPLRRARYSAYSGAPFANGWWAVLGALVWIALVMAIAWQVWLHWGQITDFVQGFASTLHGVISPWHETVERKAISMPVDTGVDFLPSLPVALLPVVLAAGGA